MILNRVDIMLNVCELVKCLFHEIQWWIAYSFMNILQYLKEWSVTSFFYEVNALPVIFRILPHFLSCLISLWIVTHIFKYCEICFSHLISQLTPKNLTTNLKISFRYICQGSLAKLNIWSTATDLQYYKIWPDQLPTPHFMEFRFLVL